MAANKPYMEYITVAGVKLPIYYDIIDKIDITAKQRNLGSGVRVSLNQMTQLSKGEIGLFNQKGASTQSSSSSIKVPKKVRFDETVQVFYFGSTSDNQAAQATPGVISRTCGPSTKKLGTLKSARKPPDPFELEPEIKPTVPRLIPTYEEYDEYTPAIPCYMPMASDYNEPVHKKTTKELPVKPSGVKQSRGTEGMTEKTKEIEPEKVETPRNEGRKIDPYGKPIYFLQDPPLPGPRAAETVPFVPASQWDDSYFESRLPTVEDVYAGREYMTDIKAPQHSVMFKRAVALSRRLAMGKLNEEQKRKIREEKWKEIVADVRGPDDPPQDMKCRRCNGTWMKVMNLNRSKGSPDGMHRKVRCLVCRDFNCFLILQQNVTWEVGRLFGRPTFRALQYGRSLCDRQMNGDPSPRLLDYLEDLEIYRWVLTEAGKFQQLPYTLVCGQKTPVRLL